MEGFSVAACWRAYREQTAVVKALAVILFYFLALIVQRVFFHSLAAVPGPFICKVTGLWRTYRYFNMSWHDDVVNLHRTYGPVVRVAPDEVSVVDGGAIKKLYSHGNKSTKSAWYKTWELSAPSPVLFSETEPKVHATLRKRLSGAYAMSSILKYEVFVQDCLSLCIARLQKHAEAGHIINMSEWTHMLAFDVVGELTFGQKLGQLETESDLDDIRKINTSDVYWAGNFGHLWLQSWWLDNPYLEYCLKWFGAKSNSAKFQAWCYDRIMKRKEGVDGSSREDLLTHFLKMKPLEGKPSLEDVEVIVETVNVIGAGADTTAIAMRSCLYFICLNPEVYSRLQQEIDDYHNTANLQQPITYLQTQELPYLKAVITEATRLLPSIVYQLLRYVPEDGLQVGKHFLPAKTQVGMSAIAANRDKQVWGEDAEDFRPERWLESVERTSFLESHNMTYGGHGPRACIGRNLALVEIQKFVSQMIYNFDIEIVDRQTPWKIKTYWFLDQLDFNLKLTRRLH